MFTQVCGGRIDPSPGEPLMLGIDVSKAILVVTLVCPSTRKVLLEENVPNTQAGIALLLAKVDSSHPWVLEPTGRYSLLAASLSKAAGRQVLLASPRKAREFLKSIQSRAKTDKLDSRGLALYALAVPLPPYPVKSQKTQELEQLLRARKGLSQSLTRLQMQTRELPAAAAVLSEAILALKKQIKVLDKQIAAKVAERGAGPLVARLKAVPGIGAVTASTVAAVLCERTFPEHKHFVAFVGLDVRERQSGKRARNLGLSHQGDAELRRLFYVAAQASLRARDRSFKALYDQQRAKGRSHTAACCIVARKLAKICWSLARHNSTYDPARISQQAS